MIREEMVNPQFQTLNRRIDWILKVKADRRSQPMTMGQNSDEFKEMVSAELVDLLEDRGEDLDQGWVLDAYQITTSGTAQEIKEVLEKTIEMLERLPMK